jgi:DNA-binding NarL/FixJ family response regulator
VLLADDHHMVRAGIRELLEGAGDLQVVAEAGDGEEAQALIQKHKPDVAVLDIQMPKWRHRRALLRSAQPGWAC